MDDLLQEMIRPAGPTATERARRRRLIASAATVGLAVVGVTSLTTSALFSDNDSANGGGFTTGSVNVTLDSSDFAVVVDNLAPGDTVYRALTVDNPGSLAYRYAVTKSWTDSNTTDYVDADFPLSGVLQLATYGLPAGTACSAATVAGVTPIRPLDLVTAGAEKLLGNLAQGTQTGDRELSAATSEVLCFQVTLPLGVGNEYQLSTSTLAVQVLAEQVANNP